MEKVKLPREVDKAINTCRMAEMTDYGIIVESGQKVSKNYPRSVLESLEVIRKFTYVNAEEFDEGSSGADILVQALVNGWDVEQTAENKVKEYFQTCRSRTVQEAIIRTIDLLNIKISGVNTK